MSPAAENTQNVASAFYLHFKVELAYRMCSAKLTFRTSLLESDNDSEEDESDDDFPMKRSTSTLFSGHGSKIFETENSYYPDCVYVLSSLLADSFPERYNEMFDFGKTLTLQAISPISIRHALKNDSKSNKLVMLLMDTIAFQEPNKLLEVKKLFLILFPSTTINVRCPKTLAIKRVNRYIITTGEIKSILTGLVLSRKMNSTKHSEWRKHFNTLSSANLCANEAFSCVATVLLEVFLYNNIELRPSPIGGIGLFANTNFVFDAKESIEEQLRVCCGLNLRTKCLSTLNHLYLKQIKKTRTIKSIRPGNRGNQKQIFMKYAASKNNRGIFGVVYDSNSNRAPVGMKLSHNSIANTSCIAFGKVDINMLTEKNGVYEKLGKKSFTCELCYLSVSANIKKNDELVWDYDWERVRQDSDGTILKLSKLEQLVVPTYKK